MYHGFRNASLVGFGGDSPPSEAWLFAQAILGNPISDPRAAAERARHERELLEFAASISDRARDEIRRLRHDEVQLTRDRELLEWLASISEEHERELRELQREDAEVRQRYTHLIESLELQEAQWDAAKHPRRGGAPNAGWFATTGGSSSRAAPNSISGPSNSALPRASFQTVGYTQPTGTTKGKNQSSAQRQSSGGAPSESSAMRDTSASPPSTKSQLPASNRGSWVTGTNGDGVFRYNDSLENQKAGLAGKEVRFENQNIAVGGLPAEAYYESSASTAKVEIDVVTGTGADNRAADAAMRKKLGKPEWRRPTGYVWNHAGPPGSKAMELVKEGVHRATSHKGPAAEPRAVRRAASTRGGAGRATGRAMGALTVYLTARDALQAAGVLQPDFEEGDRETYHFLADDGSVFIVWPGGLLSGASRKFVAGPRKGQTEKITSDQVDSYRKQAEAEWGKYIPGSLFSEPRFIPGKKRKSLPLIEYRDGVPYDAGWIDEDGVHRHSNPRMLPI